MSKSIKTGESFRWIDLENPTEEELRDITDPFNIDINLLEDSLEYGHLPKIEKVNDYTFIILRAFSADPNEKMLLPLRSFQIKSHSSSIRVIF